MRMTRCLLLSALATWCLATPLTAGIQDSDSQPTADTPAQSLSGKGTIRTIDVNAGTIDIRVTDDKGKNAMTLVLTILPTTKMTKNKKPAAIADLKTGDAVTFTFTAQNDPASGSAVTIDAKAAGKGTGKY
jgi:Cu/Ag efflux protein CusF